MHRLSALLLVFAACAAQAEPQSNNSELSNASQIVGQGSALVLFGSMSALVASGNVVVKGIEASGDATIVVLAGASNAAEASIKLSGRVAEGLSVAVGTTVSVVAMSTGYVLVASGKVIAFIPNEIGKALLHQSRVATPRG